MTEMWCSTQHLRRSRYLALTLLCGHPAFSVAEERICKPGERDGRDYEIRWAEGDNLELRGKLYSGKSIHWSNNGGWRTGGIYYRTAGFDDHGVHHIYLNQTRYEFDPAHGDGGRLYHHTTTRLTSPEDEAKVKQYQYDHPFPPETLAREPIQTTGFDRGTTRAMYIADCQVVADGTLKLSSDYSIWEIFMIYMREALEREEEESEKEK